MKWFGRKHTQPERKSYDPAEVKPVIRSSICTGEKVAGFKNCRTGSFQDIMLIRNPEDLETFLATYGIDAGDLTTEY